MKQHLLMVCERFPNKAPRAPDAGGFEGKERTVKEAVGDKG
jgi:hypothetical protein